MAWGGTEVAGAVASKPATAPSRRPSSGLLEQGQQPGLHDRAARWQRTLLGKGGLEERPLFSAWTGRLDEPNQRVIRADCERTRADVEFFRRPEVRAKMEAMLTCWCQQQQARYKQGLNEVLAPFLYLQSVPGEGTPSDDEVFACFGAFLRRFAPFFDSDDFVPLQCAFVFFRRLLLYHRPDLHNLLVERSVSPDMFCMPWFLTLFASKTPLRLCLQLWDRHLERDEPPFFVFLAAAVLANAEQAVLSAERSQLPEILTSLGLASREELEALWSAAEGLYNRTPATFAARLRRNVLRAGVSRASASARQGGQAAGDREEASSNNEAAQGGLLEKLEQERCFFILPEEVVGHCYPVKAGGTRKPWQPAPACPWRLLVLDLRPRADFEAARLPAALHFDPFSSSGGPGAAQGPWAAGRRLLQWGLEPAGALEPPRVFEALKATLGEDWVCDREAHICLLGAAVDAALVRSLYEVLTAQLTYWHVSVASGGFEAVVACARKQGFEIVRSDAPLRSPLPGADAWASASARAAAESEANRWGEKFASAWSNLRRAAGTAAGSAGGRSGADGAAGDAAPRSPRGAAAGDGGGGGEAPALAPPGAPPPAAPAPGAGAGAAPRLRERPGNWPRDVDLSVLPTRPRAELLVPGLNWACVAVVVRLAGGMETERRPAGAATPWEGCLSLLAILGDLLICAEGGSSERAGVLAEFKIASVLKVTSKKQAPEVLIFYFHDDASASAPATPPQAPEEAGGSGVAAAPHPEPAMVLHFVRGTEDVRDFIRALRGAYVPPPAEARPAAEAAGAGAGGVAGAAVAAVGKGGGKGRGKGTGPPASVPLATPLADTGPRVGLSQEGERQAPEEDSRPRPTLGAVPSAAAASAGSSDGVPAAAGAASRPAEHAAGDAAISGGAAAAAGTDAGEAEGSLGLAGAAEGDSAAPAEDVGAGAGAAAGLGAADGAGGPSGPGTSGGGLAAEGADVSGGEAEVGAAGPADGAGAAAAGADGRDVGAVGASAAGTAGPSDSAGAPPVGAPAASAAGGPEGRSAEAVGEATAGASGSAGSPTAVGSPPADSGAAASEGPPADQ